MTKTIQLGTFAPPLAEQLKEFGVGKFDVERFQALSDGINLWLGVGPIRTQADANRLIPELLKVPAAFHYGVFQPTEEIDLTAIDVGYDCHTIDVLSGTTTIDSSSHPKLGWLIIRGGEEPMHPDHVRSLVKQCEAADVPCWLEWGEWAPRSAFPCAHSPIGDKHMFKDGAVTYKVGPVRSGSTLDGQEWRMVPGAVKPQEAT